jgi:hypothetical protein
MATKATMGMCAAPEGQWQACRMIGGLVVGD